MALVVAARPREVGTDADLLATLATDPSADVVRLPPLTRAAVAQLVEEGLEAVPDPAFVTACILATNGVPFLMRELVDALSEGRIAPTAEAARHVERIGGRSVGRSIHLRLRRLPEPAGRFARALAVLEEGGLHEASQLAELDDAEGRRGRATRRRWHSRGRPPAGVRSPDRSQRHLLGLDEQRAQS